MVVDDLPVDPGMLYMWMKDPDERPREWIPVDFHLMYVRRKRRHRVAWRDIFL